VKHLRQIFWRERLWERYFIGEFDIIFKPCKPKLLKDLLGTQIAWSQELIFTDPAKGGIEVARCHWYLDVHLSPAGSGQPDPKDIMLGDINYRIWRTGDPPCPMCPLLTAL
jgi:hypothetical protein